MTLITPDPLLTFQFVVEVGGSGMFASHRISGYFTELGGLSDQQEVIEYQYFDPATKRDKVIVVPGRWIRSNVTLKRGVTYYMEFWDWRELVKQSKIDEARDTVTITMYNRLHIAAATWILENAWPSKLSGPEFDTANSEVGIEELTIEFDNIYREKPTAPKKIALAAAG